MIDKKLVEAVLEVLDDEKNFTQEQAELLLFYVDTKNEPLKKAFATCGIDFDRLKDYYLFIILWTIFKEKYKGKQPVCVNGIDFWNMDITFEGKECFLIDKDGKTITEKQYHNMVAEVKRQLENNK